jgi:hypothetical protein
MLLKKLKFHSMKMKILISVSLWLIPILFIYPQQSDTNVRFRGGMMLHSGYLKNSRSAQPVEGVCNGIGGQLSFNLGNRFRLGTEGYASNLGYRGQDGYYKLGWGGLLAGYQIGNKKLHPVLSVTLGGGKVKDLYFTGDDLSEDDTYSVIYRNYPVMLAAPAVSLEYALKSKLTLVLKLDYLIPLFSVYKNDYAFGPRLYLGILFNRS